MVGLLQSEFDGDGRCRVKHRPQSKAPSHYQFAVWVYDEGKRYAMPVGGVARNKRPDFPLISTAVRNPTGTETLLWIHLDLDFKRAAARWIRDGRMHWPTIAEHLKAEVPDLMRYLVAVTRSSGGKGLSLAIAVSPLELIDATAEIQQQAFRLQSTAIRILNRYELGADEGARGLKRLMPNFFQPDRLIDRDEMTEAIIHTKRTRVIQNLTYALRFHSALRPQAKRERTDLLWPDIRVELPCAAFYTDLLDAAGPWGSVQLRAKEIMEKYGISKNSVYKLLLSPPAWLGVVQIPGEGFRLTIKPSRQYSDRAFELLENGRKAGTTLAPFSVECIPAPESVLDGERNSWLVSVVLAAKWKGVHRSELLAALKHIVRRVQGFQSSQSMTRGLHTIIRSLYHHRANRFGENHALLLPFWLSEALSQNTPIKLSQISRKKGTCVAGFQADVSGSVDLPDRMAVAAAEVSPAKGSVRPGVRGGPGPCIGGDSTTPEPVMSSLVGAQSANPSPEVGEAGRGMVRIRSKTHHLAIKPLTVSG